LAVHHWNTALDGEFSEAAFRAKLERLGYRVARYIYQAGTVFPDHRHEIDKVDAVVSGKFRLVIGGHVVLLGQGDWVDVPRGVVHNATVQGDESVVSFDAIKFDASEYKTA
jgi:quercetin dioxygenase-like cupin family protein